MKSTGLQDNYSDQVDHEKDLNLLFKIGSILRKARESKGISTRDLSKSLRIGEEQLIALENGEENLLPEPVYIQAMIRRISEKLQLSPEELILMFQPKVPISKEELKITGPNYNRQISFSKATKDLHKVKLSLGIICLILLGLFIKQSNLDIKKLSPINHSYQKKEFGTEEEIPSLTKAIGIQIQSTKPSKIKIISMDGKILFNGILRRSLSYPPNQKLDIYANRPDLIRIKIEGRKPYKLGKRKDLVWYRLNDSK